jgi:ankyrin repeat protein
MLSRSVPEELILAIRSREIAAVRAALKAAPHGARRPRAILEAARVAFLPAIELLCRAGADLNASYRNYRPLHVLLQEEPHADASRPLRERLACLGWLLEHGADPELTGAWPPARALIIAAFTGEPDYVKRLMEAGARIDGFSGAALGDRRAVEKALRERPEFARERDHGGLTALQCAAGSRLPDINTVEIARLLIANGADVRARTAAWGHELDATYFAAGSTHVEMFRLLLEHDADPCEALAHAVWGQHFELAELAIAHGADPDRAEANGKPLLNDLIRWGQMSRALWLLARKASPNIPDTEGWTAVHQAAARGNTRMMQALIAAGGDVARRDRAGRTPYDVAKDAKREKLLAMIASA